MKPNQIIIKLNPRIKTRAEKAAAILGMSLTDYVATLVDEDTTRILNAHGNTTLELNRFKALVKSSERAAGSNQGLREAIVWAKRLRFDGAATKRMGKGAKE